MFVQNSKFNFKEVKNSIILNRIKNKFVIVLDFDGVITAPYELKVKYLNKLGYNLSNNNCSRDSCLAIGIRERDYEKASIHAYTSPPDVLPLEEGFLENFSKIRNLPNVLIFILTSRYDSMMGHMEEFLKYHNIKVDGVINTNNLEKYISLKDFGAKVFVEDTLSKIKQITIGWPDVFENCNLIFFKNAQNNLDKNNDERVGEVFGWKDLPSRILTLI